MTVIAKSKKKFERLNQTEIVMVGGGVIKGICLCCAKHGSNRKIIITCHVLQV